MLGDARVSRCFWNEHNLAMYDRGFDGVTAEIDAELALCISQRQSGGADAVRAELLAKAETAAKSSLARAGEAAKGTGAYAVAAANAAVEAAAAALEEVGGASVIMACEPV